MEVIGLWSAYFVTEGSPTLHIFKQRSKKIWWNKNEQDGDERILQINFNVFSLDDAMLRWKSFSSKICMCLSWKKLSNKAFLLNGWYLVA